MYYSKDELGEEMFSKKITVIWSRPLMNPQVGETAICFTHVDLRGRSQITWPVMGGGGVCQMIILLYKPYRVKVAI